MVSVNGESGVVVLTTDSIEEGLLNRYFTDARVRATVLTGFTVLTGTVGEGDTVIQALGKLQGQIGDFVLKEEGKGLIETELRDFVQDIRENGIDGGNAFTNSE